MWAKLASLVLRNRYVTIAVVSIITIFMGYKASKVELAYDFKKLIPATDSAYIEYSRFKDKFGEDGNVMVIGIETDRLFEKEVFNSWCDLTRSYQATEGIQRVLSIQNIYNIIKNDSLRRFELKQVMERNPETQVELDSLKTLILGLPFYHGLLFTADGKTTLMALTLNNQKLNSVDRISLVGSIKDKGLEFQKKHGIQVHFSGMPLIRTVFATKIAQEVIIFIVLGFLVTAFILLIFFRSGSAVIFPMLLVAIGVVWSLGFLVIFGFKISMLTGLIPSIIIVIGVPNCIYFINKYHYEYRLHSNKALALQRIISKIGVASLLANATTAIGFGVFYFSGSQILKEFGLISALSIMSMYALSLVMISVIFSFLPVPTARQTKHLDNKALIKVVDFLNHLVAKQRKWIYITVISLIVISLYGFTKLRSVGYMVDDLPQSDILVQDLRFFERKFNGVMPYEIAVDALKKNGIMRLKTMQKIDSLQQFLSGYKEFAKPLSVVELIKFSKQAFYNGNVEMYSLPDESEISFLARYIGKRGGTEQLLKSMLDSNRQEARISVQMADVGSNEIERITKEVNQKIDEIFPKEQYRVVVTGTSWIFLKGNDYMVNNLVESLILAFVLITLIMVFLFRTWQMVFISIIPNLIPIIITIGLMGYADIHLKPSTILIFSIAYGLSSDFTIYFLNRYRHELKRTNDSISKIVSNTIRETGVSMIYTTMVLFFGFVIYSASTFGGTKAMGVLISFTLVVALISNLLFLPCLLLWLEKSINKKAMQQGIIEIEDGGIEKVE